MRTEQILFSARADSINKETGILSGVSMVTIGPVRSHGVYADAKTLETVRACAETHKGGLKVKMEHGTGADNIVGVLKAHRIDDDRLRADLHLLTKHAAFAKLLEMAETIPEAFGLSISFSGEREVIEVAGVKIEAARCTEIYSCDVVDSPAANPGGLFSEKKPKAGRRKQFQDGPATLEQIDDTVLDIQDTVDTIENEIAAIQATEAAILAGVQALQTMLPELVQAAVKQMGDGNLIALRRLGSMGVPAGTLPPANQTPAAPPAKSKTWREQLEAIPANDIAARQNFMKEHKAEIYAEMQPGKR